MTARIARAALKNVLELGTKVLAEDAVEKGIGSRVYVGQGSCEHQEHPAVSERHCGEGVEEQQHLQMSTEVLKKIKNTVEEAVEGRGGRSGCRKSKQEGEELQKENARSNNKQKWKKEKKRGGKRTEGGGGRRQGRKEGRRRRRTRRNRVKSKEEEKEDNLEDEDLAARRAGGGGGGVGEGGGGGGAIRRRRKRKMEERRGKKM